MRIAPFWSCLATNDRFSLPVLRNNMRYWGIVILSAITFAASSFAEVPKRKADPSAVKPLTYANVVAFFKEADLQPAEVQKRCTIFFEGEWTNANIYNYCVIIVENSDEDIQVTFYLTDAHEMNWVTEFLDGPFFAPGETQKLFGLINSGRDMRAGK